MKQAVLTLLSALALGCAGFALADEKLERVAVRVEQNATDKDFEIVFEATGGDVGLATLKVAAPDGRMVVDFKTPDTKLGIRHFNLESPEPKTLDKLQADYPAGEYTFTASTVAGAKLSSKATLSHKLPAAASFVSPGPDEANVPLRNLQIKWNAAKNLASCLVAIEDDQTGVKIVQAKLPGGATTFPVPDILKAGTKYKVAIGTVAQEGNATFVETSFTTARK